LSSNGLQKRFSGTKHSSDLRLSAENIMDGLLHDIRYAFRTMRRRREQRERWPRLRS
jgi:hypothetical protein